MTRLLPAHVVVGAAVAGLALSNAARIGPVTVAPRRSRGRGSLRCAATAAAG